ncbi:hypothetical protein BDZ91DRAFT_730893 [Kalaharituber pfeilii]|nr:hypothetical protein BDZ91DRAFT_730893 [Kalaharituber pfeilii]
MVIVRCSDCKCYSFSSSQQLLLSSCVLVLTGNFVQVNGVYDFVAVAVFLIPDIDDIGAKPLA